MPSFLLALSSWLRDLEVVPSATILTTSAFAIWILLPPSFVDGILPALHHLRMVSGWTLNIWAAWSAVRISLCIVAGAAVLPNRAASLSTTMSANSPAINLASSRISTPADKLCVCVGSWVAAGWDGDGMAFCKFMRVVRGCENLSGSKL